VTKALLIFFQNRNSLPTAFVDRWQKALCRLPFSAGGKGLFANCLPWQVAKDSLPAFIERWQSWN
jgi:hypothetical protein